MPASKSAAASPAARASSSHSDAAHRQEPPTLNVHYVPARMPAGVVTGLWGGAVRREDDGSTTPLKLGDVVRKGDVLLTEQRGIVQLTVDGKQFLTTGDPELDKLVARLDDGELDFVTGAGGEGGEGSLQAGLIVDRVIEVVSRKSTNTHTTSTGKARTCSRAPQARRRDRSSKRRTSWSVWTDRPM